MVVNPEKYELLRRAPRRLPERLLADPARLSRPWLVEPEDDPRKDPRKAPANLARDPRRLK
jgi:hypothetical protein